MGLRQIAIVTAFLMLWVFSQLSHAEVTPRQDGPSIPVASTLKSTIAKIHSYVFMAFNGGLSDLKRCEMGADLFDFSQWLALPMGVTAAQVCEHKGFGRMIGELAETLVIKPRQMIAQYAADLMTTNDVALATFKGDAYVQLKHYLIEMQSRPLDFALAGEPRKLDLDEKSKTQRLNIPIQLASGLIGKLEELQIEPKAAAGIRELALARYTMKMVSSGELRLERIELPNMIQRVADR